MLNNANIMAGEDVEKSSYILTKLDDLLHYQVNEGLKKTVRLKDDIEFISDYLELEKIRRDNFIYNIHIEGNTNIDVPPLLFIPFVENAVKHNPENDSYVEIIFRITGNNLYFECKNPKAKLHRVREEGGIGLVNMRKRPELLFEKDYSLNLKDEKEVYTVILECRI
jgi:LytS/YehU family sensor histidine kinase